MCIYTIPLSEATSVVLINVPAAVREFAAHGFWILRLLAWANFSSNWTEKKERMN